VPGRSHVDRIEIGEIPTQPFYWYQLEPASKLAQWVEAEFQVSFPLASIPLEYRELAVFEEGDAGRMGRPIALPGLRTWRIGVE